MVMSQFTKLFYCECANIAHIIPSPDNYLQTVNRFARSISVKMACTTVLILILLQHFQNMHDASVAVEALDESAFMGSNLQVELSKNQSRRGGGGGGGGPPMMGGHHHGGNSGPGMMPGYPYPPPHMAPYGMLPSIFFPCIWQIF